MVIKTVIIQDRPVKLYSLDDGKTWFTESKDFESFRERVEREFITCRKQFHVYAGAKPDPGERI